MGRRGGVILIMLVRFLRPLAACCSCCCWIIASSLLLRGLGVTACSVPKSGGGSFDWIDRHDIIPFHDCMEKRRTGGGVGGAGGAGGGEIGVGGGGLSGSNMVRTKSASVVEIAAMDAEEIAMTSSHQNKNGKKALSLEEMAILDLGEGDPATATGDAPPFPTELLFASFGSKLFLVWDPKRTEGDVVLDLHSGAHAKMNKDKVQPWQIHGARNVIASLGGIQTLLPVFHRLLSGAMEEQIRQESSSSAASATAEQQQPLSSATPSSSSTSTTFDGRIVFPMIPHLIDLLTSFLRGHDENAREILRCGGIDILEHTLMSNREKTPPPPPPPSTTTTQNDTVKNSAGGNGVGGVPSSLVVVTRQSSFMGAVATHRGLAHQLVDSLIHLRAACSQYDSLEATVTTRLLFNLPLWFGDPSIWKGVALYAALMPLLSIIVCSSPKKMRDCIGVRPLIESLRLYTNVGGNTSSFVSNTSSTTAEEKEGVTASTPLFQRGGNGRVGSKADGDDDGTSQQNVFLTIPERRHVIDILFGMILTMLVQGATVQHLAPLINYISYNADFEWEVASQDANSGRNPTIRAGSRKERHLATLKAASILVVLLRGRPVVPHLLAALLECCEGKQGVASWILGALVNSYDDEMRSYGIRCLANYLDILETSGMNGANFHSNELASLEGGQSLPTTTLSRTFSTVGRLASIGTGGMLSSVLPPSTPVNTKVVYKLLWHLIKSHRSRMGEKSHLALVHVLLFFDRIIVQTCDASQLSQEVAVLDDDVLQRGFRLDTSRLSSYLKDTEEKASSSKVAGTDICDTSITPGLSIVLRLIRFLKDEWKDKWIDQMVLLSRHNMEALVSCPEWMASLFHLLSDIVEVLSSAAATHDRGGGDTEDSSLPSSLRDTADDNTTTTTITSETSATTTSGSSVNDSHPKHEAENGRTFTLEKRFNTSLMLYSSLLAHCFRSGGDKALRAIEQAASLQRVCVNGHEVLCLILNHLMADLYVNGTVRFLPQQGGEGGASSNGGGGEDRNWKLKESARKVTTAILANKSDGPSASTAVKQWRALRHLTAVIAGVITKSGLRVGELFEEDNAAEIFLDPTTRGLLGIRLSEQYVAGTQYSEYMDILRLWQSSKKEGFEPSRRISIALASQSLSIIDAFVFPESLDASLPASQLHGLALVRSNEPRLGVSQGPLLASLVRLSLILLSQLEPCSVKFLQCCSRLRCLVHWSLELIRESVSLAGYSAAFHDLTAPLDRLILTTVLHCHKALSRSSRALHDMETSKINHFDDDESRNKNGKRLLRNIYELREIVVACFRGRNEVLRAALSHEAFESLQKAIEYQPAATNSRGSSKKEEIVRNFLGTSWVQRFHATEKLDHVAVPGQVANGQVHEHKTSSHRGLLALQELFEESKAIEEDFNRALNAPFEEYCEDQRRWAETDAVRDVEYDGITNVQRLSGKHRVSINDASRSFLQREFNAISRRQTVERNVVELWNSNSAHWMLSRVTDRLKGRVLLSRNRAFDDHAAANYELMLGIEREKAIRDREERLQKKKQEEMAAQLAEVLKRNESAFNPQGIDDVDIEEVQTMDETKVSDNPQEETEDATGDLDKETTVGGETVEINEDSDDGVLVEENPQIDDDAWAKAFIWADTETIVARFGDVRIVTLRSITEGKLLLTTHGLYFKQTGDVVNVMTKKTDDLAQADSSKGAANPDLRWRLSRLTEVHGRRFMLRAQAIELFFSDSHELFISFDAGARERDRFYAKLRNSCKVPMLWSPKSLNPRIVFKRTKVCHQWKRGEISNFQYLMALNKMAGRTFNDITQYPVFPWVLADYTSETIDLSDSRVYRDLTKPVGALNDDRLSSLIERYNQLASFGFSEKERFLYGSHYSAPGVTLHFLVRQEPFTTMAIELQSGRFDCADRLFFDIAGCWKSCNTSSSDVKELIPELFTCPEVFINTNNFPLGTTQTGRAIDDVGLPPWARGSSHEFVRIHRLALESEYVSRNLNHWIDLIFGFKQRGPEAEASHNLFHYLSYEGAVDLDKINDEVDRKATESHIQNFGQTPSQLLSKEPHPLRNASESRWRPLIYNHVVPTRLRFHTPSRQFGGDKKAPAKGAVVSLHVLTDTIVAIYADMTIGTYRFAPSRSGKHPFVFKIDKHRPMGRRELSTSRSALKKVAGAPAAMGKLNSNLAVGVSSFALTVGGEVKEGLRRKAQQARSNRDAIAAAEVNTLIVSCGYWDNSVKVHSLDGPRLKRSSTGGHRGAIRCLAMGDDGALMVTGGDDATCCVWVVAHPDMAIALSSGYVKTVLGESIDEDQSLACCHVLWGHTAPISCLSVSSDLDVVVSGSLHGAICVHTVRRGEYMRTIYPNGDGDNNNIDINRVSAVRKIALDAHGNFVAHMEDHSLHVYTVNGVHLCSADAMERLHSMIICSDGEILVTGGERGCVAIRTTHDLQIKSMLDLSKHGPIRCLALTPPDLNPIPQFLFIGSGDGTITVVDEDPFAPTDDGGKEAA